MLDENELVEFRVVALHRAPLLVHALEVDGIEASFIESFERHMAPMTARVFVRRQDLARALADHGAD